MKNTKLSLQDLMMIAMCTAIIAVMAQFSIPMPAGVPMTMQTFAITLVAVILGAKRGGISVLIYILLGAVGVPVFANFTGGLHLLADPTGGFLWSFPLMAYLIGFGAERYSHSKLSFVLFLTLGTVVNYTAGVLFFCLITKLSISAGIAACVLPFIPTAVIKAVLASAIGLKMKGRLAQAVWN